MYKWLTSILLIFNNKHVNKYQLLQIAQRGSKQGCAAGTVNNLPIDDTVMRMSCYIRNLFCFWIDVRKAFDSASHSWLIKMLKTHRFPRKLVTIFISIMKSWSAYIEMLKMGTSNQERSSWPMVFFMNTEWVKHCWKCWFKCFELVQMFWTGSNIRSTIFATSNISNMSQHHGQVKRCQHCWMLDPAFNIVGIIWLGLEGRHGSIQPKKPNKTRNCAGWNQFIKITFPISNAKY